MLFPTLEEAERYLRKKYGWLRRELEVLPLGMGIRYAYYKDLKLIAYVYPTPSGCEVIEVGEEA